MKSGLQLAAFFSICVLFAAFAVCAESDSLVIERTGVTSVNWSDSYIDAEGTGKVPESVQDKPKAYVLALETAKANAFRNLLEAAKSVRVDSLTELRDLMRQDDAFKARVDELIYRARIEEREFSYSQKTVKVVIRMPLRGDLIRAILPYYKGRKIETAASMPSARTTDDGQAASPAPADQDADTPEQKSAAVQSGVIIIAKGIQPGPALMPRILDETGREVYGPLQVDAETAARVGLAVYYRCSSCREAESRVENKPLIIRALRTEGPGRSNILISNMDAERLKAADSMSHFLSKAKVAITVD
jgi:hypothetical protein